MKKQICALSCTALLLTGTALAAEPEPTQTPPLIEAAQQTETPTITLYPAEVRVREENGVHRLERVYYLTAKDDPAAIPTDDFEREGRVYTLLEILKTDQTETDTKEHIEVITQQSDTKDMTKIIQTLEPELEIRTEDGYTGLLTLDYPAITVEAAGYKTSNRAVSAQRTYPNLSDADVSLIPKSIEDSGRTLTLADVEWQQVASDYAQGYELAPRYTALATYTGTATSKYATGYTVTAQYKGEVTKTSSDTIVYTAVFSSMGAAHDKQSSPTLLNYALLLIPLGGAGLGTAGYFGYKGYKKYQNKKRGYE